MKSSKAVYNKNIIALIIFAVSMGFLEAIVVVYVRELYYPEGFEFPLIALPPKIVLIELIRELTTLLMLGSVAWITGRSLVRRLSVFIFLFGIWDIIYYVALKFFLDWPESLLTWDILFLIPITWTGPVLAPVICSVLMIGMAALFERFYIQEKLNRFKWKELFFIFGGAFIIFISFVYDFASIILKGNFLSDFFQLAEDKRFLNELTEYVPDKFQWTIFAIGLVLIILGNFLIIKRANSNKK